MGRGWERFRATASDWDSSMIPDGWSHSDDTRFPSRCPSHVRTAREPFNSCARDLRMPANDLIARAESMIERMAHAVPQVAGLRHRKGIDEPVIGRLADADATHSLACRERLANSKE